MNTAIQFNFWIKLGLWVTPLVTCHIGLRARAIAVQPLRAGAKRFECLEIGNSLDADKKSNGRGRNVVAREAVD